MNTINKRYHHMFFILLVLFFLSCNNNYGDSSELNNNDKKKENNKIDFNNYYTNEDVENYEKIFSDKNNEKFDIKEKHNDKNFNNKYSNESDNTFEYHSENDNNNLLIEDSPDDSRTNSSKKNKYKNYHSSIENYLRSKGVPYEDVIFSEYIPDFVKNTFFEEAFNVLATTRVDEIYGRFKLEDYHILQPSRLSISSSMKVMIETHNLSKGEIDNNQYKDVIFPDLLINPHFMNNEIPVEVAKILFVIDYILTDKILSFSIKKSLFHSRKDFIYESVHKGLTKEEIESLNINKDILNKVIKSILTNIEFFDTYTNYNFYKVLNHPYMVPLVIKAFKEILREDSLNLNPALFLESTNLEKYVMTDRSVQNLLNYEITKGKLYKHIVSEDKISSKYIKSVMLSAIFYNFMHYNKAEIKDLDMILKVLKRNKKTASSTLNDILDLSYEILRSDFPKSFITTNKLIRIYHKYHLSGGISGLSYGSLSWYKRIGEELKMYLISGDYEIYEMPMDSRQLISISDIYNETMKRDIFLPIFEFEYSSHLNIAMISVSRPTYINSYIFDFKSSKYREINSFFNKKVFTSIGYMDHNKNLIVAQSLNAETEKDELILIDLRGYRVEHLLSDCKINTLEISPNGNKVLITGDLDSDDDTELDKPYVYNLITKNIMPIPVESNWSQFSWDIKKEDLIYYAVGNKDVYSYNMYTNTKKKILSTDLFIYHLAAGEKMFAFSYLYQDTGESRLYLYDTETTTNTLIETVDKSIIKSGFSPNGQYLVYEIVREDDYKDLYLLEVSDH